MGIKEDRRQRDRDWDGDQIRRLRRHAGLSQRELADELNARQQTISEWERGEYAPRGTAARLLTRVAEDVRFPFKPDPSPASEGDPESDREPDATTDAATDTATEAAMEAVAEPGDPGGRDA